MESTRCFTSISISIILVLLMVSPIFSDGTSFPKERVVTALKDFIGETQQIGDICEFNLEIGTGDQVELLLFNRLDNTSMKFSDVNGVLILEDHKLIFSVSPVYGKPGIYQYDCKVSAPPVLMVQPDHVTVEYPEGTDYFKLKQYNNVSGSLEYHYASNVDDIDFYHFTDSTVILTKKLK